MRIIILGCMRNTEDWARKWADSVTSQHYNDYKVIAIDDASTDNTASIISEYPIALIQNPERKGYAYNLTLGLLNADLKNDDVIAIVDGDDWLPHNNVLSKLAQVYSDPECWMTYGSFIRTNGQPCHCSNFINPARNYPFVMSHLRTYKWFLMKNFPIEYLKDDVEFLTCAADMAIMIGLSEIAGANHIFWIRDTMYIYNSDNPDSIYKRDPDPYPAVERIIRSQQPLTRKIYKELINGTCDWR